MRLICVLYFSFFLTTIVAQENVRVSFSLIDETTKAIIERSAIKLEVKGRVFYSNTNYKSRDTIELQLNKNDVLNISASASGFDHLQRNFNLSEYDKLIRKEKVIPIELQFEFDGQNIIEIDVNATYEPEVVFSSDSISVSDFEVIDEQNMLLLTYPKRLEKSSELIWSQNGEILNRVDIPATAVELIRDYQGNIYLKCNESTYLISKNQQLNLQKVDEEGLENYILPILDTLEADRVYFSNYNEWYPAFDYFMVKKADSSYTTIKHIEDSEMMEHYRAEYKWADVRTKLWAWDMEAESGIDREIWVGANIFTNTIYYEKPYSPMFLVDEVLMIFDHYSDLLFKVDAYNCETFDSTSINYHTNSRKSGWERELIQDPITKSVFTYFDYVGNTTLKQIDFDSGKLIGNYKLFYRYVENITIYNDKVYYIYRPFESMQKKYLYVETLDEMKERYN
ncbi:MAG: hypothetical protein WEA99_03230 [Brumimicrobium sp.]